MANKTKSPWVVIDAKAQVLRCDRCLDTFLLASINGQRIEIFMGTTNGFLKAHGKCKAP